MGKKETFILTCFFTGTLWWCLYAALIPNYIFGTFHYPSGRKFDFYPPEITVVTQDKHPSIDITLSLAPIHPTYFKTYGYDVADLILNEQSVKPLLDPNLVQQWVDLAPYLKAGMNTLHVSLDVHRGWVNFYLIPDVRDRVMVSLIVCAAIGIIALVLLFARMFPRHRLSKTEAAIFVGGSLLRLSYFLSTAYLIRSYDLRYGHIPYIQLLATRWQLPVDTRQSFEYFQPPGYYALCAVTTNLCKTLGLSFHTALQTWQAEACAMSIGSLAACLAIARILFPDDHKQRVYFLACTAAIPAFIYNFNGVNNDVLFTTASVYWLFAMLSFWKKVTFRKWLFVSLLLCMAMLSKSSGIALVAISLLLLACTRQIGRQAKLIMTVVTTLLLLVTNGWFYIPRAVQSKRTVDVMVSNLDLIPKSLYINENLVNFITFDPLSVVQYPYSHQWDGCDPRNNFFWEYFFKSAFFGECFFCNSDENVFIEFARAVVISALLLLPAVFLGLRTVKKLRGYSLPMAVVTLAISSAHILYVIHAPYFCSQVFRYSAILVIPLTYFCMIGLRTLRTPLRRVGEGIVVIFAASCAWFILNLVLNT